MNDLCAACRRLVASWQPSDHDRSQQEEHHPSPIQQHPLNFEYPLAIRWNPDQELPPACQAVRRPLAGCDRSGGQGQSDQQR